MKTQYRFLAAMALATAVVMPLAQSEIVDNPSFEVPGLVIVWSSDVAGNAPIVADFIVGSPGGPGTGAGATTDLITADAFTVVTGTLESTSTSIAVGGFPAEITDSVTGAGNGIVTDTNDNGSLDAGDSFIPFQLDADISVNGSTPRTSFYVASNRSFSISAELTELRVDDAFAAFSEAYLGFTLLEMEVAPIVERTDGSITYGSAAQSPHDGGVQAGFTTPFNLLTLEDGPITVFNGNRRTAASTGSIAAQSVRFDISYPLQAGVNVTGYDLSLGVVDFGVTIEYTVFVP